MNGLHVTTITPGVCFWHVNHHIVHLFLTCAIKIRSVFLLKRADLRFSAGCRSGIFTIADLIIVGFSGPAFEASLALLRNVTIISSEPLLLACLSLTLGNMQGAVDKEATSSSMIKGSSCLVYWRAALYTSIRPCADLRM